MKTKLEAFTLGELLVTLLVTTIVVGLTFTVLQLVQQQMNGLHGLVKQNSQQTLLKNALWTDFHRHNRVFINKQEGSLMFENDFGSIRYEFIQDKIIRQGDTLSVPWTRITGLFEHQVSAKGEINAIKVEMDDVRGEFIFVHKLNSATTYLNH